VSGLLFEMDAGCPHPCVIPIEIIRVQEQGNPPAGLIAYTSLLACGRSAGEQEWRFTVAVRSYNDPALPGVKTIVLDQLEAESSHVEGDGLVVVLDENGDESKVGHRLSAGYGSGVQGSSAGSPRMPKSKETSPLWKASWVARRVSTEARV